MPDEPGVPPAPLFPALPVMLPSAMVSLLMDAAELTTKIWLALFALIVSAPAPGPVIVIGLVMESGCPPSVIVAG